MEFVWRKSGELLDYYGYDSEYEVFIVCIWINKAHLLHSGSIELIIMYFVQKFCEQIQQ